MEARDFKEPRISRDLKRKGKMPSSQKVPKTGYGKV
jgi:hypothetical protein